MHGLEPLQAFLDGRPPLMGLEDLSSDQGLRCRHTWCSPFHQTANNVHDHRGISLSYSRPAGIRVDNAPEPVNTMERYRRRDESVVVERFLTRPIIDLHSGCR